MSEPAPHALVVLAAGGSRRLGQAKQLLQHEGETLLHRAARLGLVTRPAQALVIVGAEPQAMAAAVANLPVGIVRCDDWQAGMGASLRCALAALDPAIAGVLIVLCDQPALDAAHLLQLCAAWQVQPRRAAASGYAGIVGVPALLPRAWFDDADLDGDQGARGLLRRHADRVTVRVNAALAADIDQATDLTSLR